MAFGEMAFVEHALRSATVTADSDIVTLSLNRPDFDDLSAVFPNLRAKVLNNIAVDLAGRLRQTNRELATLIY